MAFRPTLQFLGLMRVRHLGENIMVRVNLFAFLIDTWSKNLKKINLGSFLFWHVTQIYKIFTFCLNLVNFYMIIYIVCYSFLRHFCKKVFKTKLYIYIYKLHVAGYRLVLLKEKFKNSIIRHFQWISQYYKIKL